MITVKRPDEDFDKYKILRQDEKIRLHAKYIACISLGVVIWLITTGTANNEEFTGWVSFASTITSIVLSVIAIILSITGETKTDVMRSQMENTADKLEQNAIAIDVANKKNEENIRDLKENILVLQRKIEQMQVTNEEVINRYQKVENDKLNNIVTRVIKTSWVGKDE